MHALTVATLLSFLQFAIPVDYRWNAENIEIIASVGKRENYIKCGDHHYWEDMAITSNIKCEEHIYLVGNINTFKSLRAKQSLDVFQRYGHPIHVKKDDSLTITTDRLRMYTSDLGGHPDIVFIIDGKCYIDMEQVFNMWGLNQGRAKLVVNGYLNVRGWVLLGGISETDLVVYGTANFTKGLKVKTARKSNVSINKGGVLLVGNLYKQRPGLFLPTLNMTDESAVLVVKDGGLHLDIIGDWGVVYMAKVCVEKKFTLYVRGIWGKHFTPERVKFQNNADVRVGQFVVTDDTGVVNVSIPQIKVQSNLVCEVPTEAT